jgi:hypothetical protein
LRWVNWIWEARNKMEDGGERKKERKSEEGILIKKENLEQ